MQYFRHFFSVITLFLLVALPAQAQVRQTQTKLTRVTIKTKATQTTTYAPVAGKLRKPTDGKIAINRATATEFQRLLGVGPVIAERIVAYRTELGGKFSRVNQLIEVKGIGPKKLAHILPNVIL